MMPSIVLFDQLSFAIMGSSSVMIAVLVVGVMLVALGANGQQGLTSKAKRSVILRKSIFIHTWAYSHKVSVVKDLFL